MRRLPSTNHNPPPLTPASFVQGQQPEVISLDAVKCEALGAVSLGYYLEFVYSGALPAFDAVRGRGECVCEGC